MLRRPNMLLLMEDTLAMSLELQMARMKYLGSAMVENMICVPGSVAVCIFMVRNMLFRKRWSDFFLAVFIMYFCCH